MKKPFIMGKDDKALWQILNRGEQKRYWSYFMGTFIAIITIAIGGFWLKTTLPEESLVPYYILSVGLIIFIFSVWRYSALLINKLITKDSA